MFADDTNIIVADKNIEEIETKLHFGLIKIRFETNYKNENSKIKKYSLQRH